LERLPRARRAVGGQSGDQGLDQLWIRRWKALRLGIDERIVGAVVVVIAIIGQAFAALIAWIGFVPLVGPLVAKVLALPFIWLINGIGYLVSLVAIKRGYSKDVISYRIATVALIVGIALGYILGKLI
jgi:hypothetical protein